MNTVQLSDAQVLVVLEAVKQETKHLHPEDKPVVASVHDHILVQCSDAVRKAVKPLIEY